jgi:manganese transport protein
MSEQPLQPANPPEGWQRSPEAPSLREVHRSVVVPRTLSFWRKMLAFSGPGYLVAVGYMDPGNWATDLAGGSAFGYSLLCVILLSNLMAILLQSLCARLGIVTGRDLAQACRDHYSKPVTIVLWVLCEVAICACDLAEVLGSAIALNLLFKIPLVWGVCITALDVFAVMYLQNKGFRYIEALVLTLILLIGGCFLAEIIFSRPDFVEVLSGFVPSSKILQDSQMLYIAIGILGATVMPHNLYLHSSIVQTRKYEQNTEGKAEAIKFATLDSTVALTFALFINSAILIVSAATFYTQGQREVEQIQEAYKLLSPMLAVPVASAVFALALLASGQNSTLTGTLAGQIVMEGFLNIRLRPWLRRLITRLIAIVPAVICTAIYANDPAKEVEAVGKLLIFSQVILSLQLSFAVIPLVLFTSDRRKMGQFVSPIWMKTLAWITASIIVTLNVKYLLDFFGVTQWLMRFIR